MNGALIAMVLPGDDRVWLETQSMVAYMRHLQEQAHLHGQEAQDPALMVGARAIEDALRQIADGLVLTEITAVETLKERRESRR